MMKYNIPRYVTKIKIKENYLSLPFSKNCSLQKKRRVDKSLEETPTQKEAQLTQQ